jgi:hypothetical protein
VSGCAWLDRSRKCRSMNTSDKGKLKSIGNELLSSEHFSEIWNIYFKKLWRWAVEVELWTNLSIFENLSEQWQKFSPCINILDEACEIFVTDMLVHMYICVHITYVLMYIHKYILYGWLWKSAFKNHFWGNPFISNVCM